MTLTQNSTATLLLHGFTSSPAFFRYTAETLRAAGFEVSSPALAGHGTTPEDLEGTGRQDWLRTAREALEDLQARHSHVFVVGHSMGSTLALQLAATNPGITGLVLMAPSVRVSRRIRLLASILSRTRRWIPRQPMAVMDPFTRDDPALQGYARIPTRALRENLAEKIDARRLLGRVTAPSLLVEGAHDPLVARGSARSIAVALGVPVSSWSSPTRAAMDSPSTWIGSSSTASSSRSSGIRAKRRRHGRPRRQVTDEMPW